MNKLSKFSFVTFTALFFFSLSTLSQEVEEVVVTATKKSESIQDNYPLRHLLQKVLLKI